MMDPVRWGVLGASKFAYEQMAPAIHAADGAEFSAIATSRAEKAVRFQAFAPGLRVYEDYDALLADPNIDAVYLPLPNHMHVEWTKKVLRAGKHVLTEKPIAMAAGEIDELIAVRDETGLLAAEAFMIVFHPQWQTAKALLADGAIGKLVHVDGAFSYDNRADMGNFRNRPETGGGSLPDIGVYPFGSTRFMTGEEPVEITAADIDWENGVDVVARVMARFPGFSFSSLTSMRMARRQEMVFHGETGVLRLTAPFNPRVFSEARVELARPDFTTHVQRFPADSHYKLQVEAFSHSVRTGEDYPNPLEFAQGTQRMIDMVLEKAGR